MPILISNDLSRHDRALIICITLIEKRIGLMGTYYLLYGHVSLSECSCPKIVCICETYVEPNSECSGLICSLLETKCTKRTHLSLHISFN